MATTTRCIDAVTSAIRECRIKCITCVPGYPITELAEHLISGADAEWCINEKVAMEIALGASASGSRSMVIVKHVGMNILADPLITASTHTTGAGVVVIAGDDPAAVASQNEQDSRYWGLLAEVPVLDPNPENLYDTIFEAYRISEAVRTPVIVRVTDPLLQSGCVCRFVEDPARNRSELHLFDRSIWEYSMHGMYQLFHRDTYPLIEDLSETSHLNRCTEGAGGEWGDGGGRGAESCIISSGYVSGIVGSILRRTGHIPHLSLSFVSPLPLTLIRDFIGDQRVLVIEETAPVIERQLQPQSRKILGRQSGHLPYGGLGEADILSAIENIGKDEIAPDTTPETLKSRGFTRSICDDCPFVPVYEAIRSVKKETGTLIAGDMGCSIRTAPTGVVDLAYSLGGAIGIASGLPGKGIAVIGDYGLVHSGLQALIDAESKGRDVLVIVLQNMVSAMTGGQEVLDPGGIIRACCSDVVTIDETAGKHAIGQLIAEKLGLRGVSVIVVSGACRRCERLIQAYP